MCKKCEVFAHVSWFRVQKTRDSTCGEVVMRVRFAWQTNFFLEELIRKGDAISIARMLMAEVYLFPSIWRSPTCVDLLHTAATLLERQGWCGMREVWDNWNRNIAMTRPCIESQSGQVVDATMETLHQHDDQFEKSAKTAILPKPITAQVVKTHTNVGS